MLLFQNDDDRILFDRRFDTGRLPVVEVIPVSGVNLERFPRRPFAEGPLDQHRWDRAFVRLDSVALRLGIVLRAFVVLARPGVVHGSPGLNRRAYLPGAPVSSTPPPPSRSDD